MKFYQSVFGKRPKGLNAINMFLATGKFVGAIMAAVMLFIAYINQVIITTPTIRMNNTIRRHFASYYSLQRGFRAIWHDLSIDFPLSLENAKDGCFTCCASATFTSAPFGTEVRLINFNYAMERSLSFTEFSNSYRNQI